MDYGLTTLNGITPLQGIAVETVLTLMLVMVYIHTTVEGGERQSPQTGKAQSAASTSTTTRSVIAPLACGVTLAAAVMSRYVLL